MNFLIYPAISENDLARVQEAAGRDVTLINAPDEAAASTQMEEVEAMYGRLTPGLFAKAKKLRWVQTSGAGLERYIFPELAESDITLTNMAGIYGDHIADHVIAFILMFARGMHLYVRHQMAHDWLRALPFLHVADQTLGIVGLGGIGREVARRAHALGMRVIAVDAKPQSKPDDVDELWESERLDDLLALADFVAICVPHTPETAKLFTLPRLQRMKPTAYLINISRGIVVDLADLTTALQQGLIAGAGLDVFEIEPLPADHPLWDMENVIITPHMASGIDSPHIHTRRIGLLCENLRRYGAGEPLLNVVDKRRWF
jgi:phosphoglycerate dehydrogenase-like enzyme